MLGSPEDAKDTAHDAYLIILKRGGVRTPKHLRHLLFRTATHRALDRLRYRRRREPRRDLPEADSDTEHETDSSEPVDRIPAAQMIHQLNNFLGELPAPQREAFLLFRFEHLPHKDIALRLGVTERTVRRYVSRALTYCALRSDGHPEEKAKELARP